MRSATIAIAKPSRLLQRLYSSQGVAALGAVDTLHGPLNSIGLHEFRHNAFIPEKPILITSKGDSESADTESLQYSIPAAQKWFKPCRHESGLSSQAFTVSYHYLSPFGATILPYEFVVDSSQSYTSVIENGAGSQDGGGEAQDLSGILNNLTKGSRNGAFHRFNAPLSLFLQACQMKSRPRLYIAQAQIADLPKQLQDDLRTPSLVKEAGKGDIYDANIWMGIPPTYTPLHRDPNPNLFVQLASRKCVRLFRPSTGASIFREIQQRIGQSSPSTFRGEEMMEGPERVALDAVVWGQSMGDEGHEVVVSPGDALFIPKGWWHSIKSIGTEVTASVNWWFR
jgi:hypothetical protein